MKEWMDGNIDGWMDICVVVDGHIDEWIDMDGQRGEQMGKGFLCLVFYQTIRQILSFSFLFFFSTKRLSPGPLTCQANTTTKRHPQASFGFFVCFQLWRHGLTKLPGLAQNSEVNVDLRLVSLLPQPPKVLELVYRTARLAFPLFYLVMSLLWVCGSHLSVSGLICYFDDFSHFVCLSQDGFTPSIHSFLSLLSLLRKNYPQ